MLIPVIYPDGKHDLVKDFYLNHLISTEKISQFKRSSGWVNIDAPDIRGKSQKQYIGPERRIALMDADASNTEAPEIEFYKE